MSTDQKDRIGQYLVQYLDEMIFDELSDAYLKKAGIEDILKEVPIPLKKTELSNISTLSIAQNMAFVIGCDPSFTYKENYIAYILRTFDENFAKGLIAYGVELAQQNHYDYACIQFRAAMQIAPENADAYYCYGRACKDIYEQGEDEELVGRFKAESLDAFEVATIKNPELAEAFYFLGYGYVNMGLYIKAKLTWEEFVKLSQDEKMKKEIKARLTTLIDPVQIEQGYNLILSGRFHEGIEILSEYKEGEYANWWPLWYYLATAYEALGDAQEAISHYLKVLTLSPSNIETIEALVAIYDTIGESDKVEKYTKKLAIIKENIEKDRELKKELQAELDGTPQGTHGGGLDGTLDGGLDGTLDGGLDGTLDGDLDGGLDGTLDGGLDGKTTRKLN